MSNEFTGVVANQNTSSPLLGKVYGHRGNS
jgi:hypothetical protein